MADALARLRSRHARLLESHAQAERAGKYTAAEGFSAQADKVEDRIIELEAAEVEAQEDAEAEQDAEALLRAIQGAARELPAYLLDDLIAALETLREVSDPDEWRPEE